MRKKISIKKTLVVCTNLVISLFLISQLFLIQCSKSGNSPTIISINPDEQFELSPYLYMQFMEPLGTTDASVDAAWDFIRDDWREDVIDITKELAPTLIRWGGCFCSYYKWKEGVGPMKERKPMYNLLWGGIYNNQVGTHEFVDFCRRVGADPLITVNFESDGREYWAKSAKGEIRLGTAEEAREWVDYCNNPKNAERIKHGRKAPYNVKLWQIGNETSYGDDFDAETGAKKTLAFAKAMREADPTIKIIAWGQDDWAKKMVEVAGDHIQYLAFHQGYGPGGEDSPLKGIEYRKDWAKTWKYFMEAYKQPEKQLLEMREKVADLGIPLATTEGHFFLPGRNRNEALSTWAAGVANARILNMYERNGDILKIATLADFCGTRWQNNAVIIPTPSGKSFMMPVAMVMSLYRKHVGQKAVKISTDHKYLDISASRTGDRIFFHVANINRTEPVTVRLSVEGMQIKSGKVFYIALDPAYEVFEYKPEITSPKESIIPDNCEWTFPAASVSAVELDVSK
jgi:alpha-N-arabinofuranosidase